VVTQEGAPSLTWRSTPPHHVFGDARLRDIKPELEQLAMDTGRSPKRVVGLGGDAALPGADIGASPPVGCGGARVWDRAQHRDDLPFKRSADYLRTRLRVSDSAGDLGLLAAAHGT
jgi:hypothetical protein